MVAALGLGPHAELAPAATSPTEEVVLPAPSPELPRCPTTVEKYSIEEGGNTGQLLVAPPSVETSMPRGGSARGCVVAENRSGKPLTVTLSVVNVIPPTTPDLGPTFGGDTPWGAGDWITLGVRTVRIPAASLVSVPYRIRAPASVASGSYDAAVLVTGEAAPGQDVAIRTGLASQIGVVIEGPVVRSGSLSGREGPRVVHPGEVPSWGVVWTNTGAVTTRIDGELVVRNSFTGTVVERRTYDEARVLRSSARRIRLAWKGVPWIGRYEATMTLTVDGKRQKVSYPATYVIPPTWFLLIAGGAMLIPVVVRIARRRRTMQELYVEELVALELAAREGSEPE